MSTGNSIVYTGFCMGGSWLSKTIEAFSHGPSHAFLLYRDVEFDGWISLGEEIGGWVSLPGEDMGSVIKLVDPGYDLWPGLRKNRQYLGSPYAVGALLGMAWWEVAYHIFKRKITKRNPFATRKSWYCSGIIQKVYQDTPETPPGKFDIDPTITDPLYLMNEVMSLPNAKEVDFKTTVSL